MFELMDLLQDPANAWMLYLIGIFLVFAGVMMHAFRKNVVAKAASRGVAVAGDNPGVIVTGEVRGDVRQTQSAPQAKGGAALQQADVRRFDRILASAANLTTIAGFALAAWTFFYHS
ncbi:MAG: hypothetical protein PVJ83_07055 [Gammaproteobacteria bacterium]|jgi:hypothetical protein